MPARVVVVLVDGRVMDVTGLDARQVVDLLKGQGVKGADIDHIRQGPLEAGEPMPFRAATRDVRRWLGGYATPEQRGERLAELEWFYDETGRNALDHWPEYLAWKSRKVQR